MGANEEAKTDSQHLADFLDVADGKNIEDEPEAEELKDSEDAELDESEESKEEEEEESEEEEPETDEGENEQEDEDDSQEEEGEETDSSEEEEDLEDLEDSEDDELEEDEDPRDAIIAKLEARLAKLENKEKAEEETHEDDVSVSIDLPEDLKKQIFGDISFDDVMENEDKFTEVIANTVKVTQQQTVEKILKSLPKLVLKQTEGALNLQRKVNQFYRKNKELRSFKPAVQAAARQVQEEHPDWSVEKVLAETGKRAKKAIGLKKKKAAEASEHKKGEKKVQRPAFAKKPKSARKIKEKKSALETEIETMINLE